MKEQEFIPKSYTFAPQKGSVTSKSPSNIALVKYWGKHGEQLPENTSISFTLQNCHTTTSLYFEEKQEAAFQFEVYLDGQREPSFEPKITTFFERIEAYVPFLRKYQFKIETVNSFPHSSGIASSASGMSALAVCLILFERQFKDKQLNTLHEVLTPFEVKKASFLARLGSGSAARSIEGPLVVWGKHSKIAGSSDRFGIKYPNTVHDNFNNYRDTILLVDKGEKQVSSTVGHNLMHGHPYAKQRFAEANKNIERLMGIFESGDISEFIKLVESEALQLHAMMMSSMPYFILMKPNTLEIINKIWNFRRNTNIPVCFTLDAGANVHVLYPDSVQEEVSAFIETELAPFCKNGEFIHDVVGLGVTIQ